MNATGHPHPLFPISSGLLPGEPVFEEDGATPTQPLRGRTRNLLAVLFLSVLEAFQAFGAELTDAQLLGTGNQIANGAELTILGGGTLTANSGSVVDFYHATLALPPSLSLLDVSLDGLNNQLVNGATLTLKSGATMTALAGSNVNLSAANVDLPTTVILTTSEQTLFSKTLVAPTISSLSSAAVTNLTLSAGSDGAVLTLGQGADGVVNSSRMFQAPGFVSNATGATAQITTAIPASGEANFLWRINLTNQSDGTGVNSSGLARGPWGAVVYDTIFSGSGKTYLDGTMGIGYNINAGGGSFLSHEPSLFWAIEPDYWDGARRNMEVYLHYNPRAGSTSPFAINHSGLGGRPIFWQINRENDTMPSFVLNTSGITFTDWETGVETANMNSNVLSLHGFASQSSPTQLLLTGQNGYGGSLKFSGATGSSIRGSSGNLTISSGDIPSTEMLLKTTNGHGAEVTALRLDSAQGASFAGNLALYGTLSGVSSLVGQSGNLTIVAGNGHAGEIALQTTNSSGLASTALHLGANRSVTANGDFKVINGDSIFHGNQFTVIAPISTFGSQGFGILRAAPGANLELQSQSAGTRVLIRPTGATVAAFDENRLSTFTGNGVFEGTTEATTAGAAALKVSGGIYSAKRLVTATDLLAGGSVVISGTTASSSTTTGALRVAGGAGVAGALHVGGQGTFGGKLRINTNYSSSNEIGFYDSAATTQYGTVGIAGTAGALSAGSAAQDLVVRSQAGLRLTAGGASDRLVIQASDGAVSLSSTTNASSVSSGALAVSGGAAIQKNLFVGADLVLTPVATPNAIIRLSGSTLPETPGIWLRDGGAPDAANVALSGSATETVLNGPANGTIELKIADSSVVSLNTAGVTLQSVPLIVTSTSESTSKTTGSATFAGGIGVAGRISSASLNVGDGATIDRLLSATAVFDFPSIAANGGVSDLTTTLSGATIGDAVNVVEAGGAFIEAGVVLRAIVTAPNIVTIRATNVTAGALNPAALSLRITLISF